MWKILEKKITNESRQDRNLRNIYEQYFYSLVKGKLQISKILENNDPTPDFKITIGDKSYITEVKGLDPIYEKTWNLFIEVCASNHREELCDSYELDVSPWEIHREDKETVREELSKIISKIDLPRDNINFQIQGRVNTYTFSLKRRNLPKGLRIAHGKGGKVTSNLRNKLFSNQYEKIDFLSFINMNQEIDENKILTEVFNGKIILFDNEEKISVINPFFFGRYKQIRLLLMIDPIKEECYFIPSPCCNKNDISRLLYSLVNTLKSSNFKIKIVSLNYKWVEI